MVREYLTFKRLTAADAPLAPGDLGERPLAVLTRGPDLIVAAAIDVIRCARDGAHLETGEGDLVLEPRDRSE